MKKLLIAMIGAALVLGACGDKEEPAPAPAPAPEQETPAADEAAAGTFDASRAEAAYSSCIGCHGQPTEGGAMWETPLATYSVEQILAAIQNGPGAMPENLVSGEEAENLAAWIAAQ